MDSVISFNRVKRFPTIIWVMLIGNFFVRGTYFMVWPFLAVILYEKFSLSATEVGMILSTAAGFSVLIGMYGGNLSDRKGRKPFMLAATVIGVIAFALLAFADSLEMFIAAAFLATLPRGLWTAPSKALIGDLLSNPKDRELALQSLYFMVNAGAVVGPALGVWMGLTGEQFSFIYTAVTYMGLCLAILLVFTKASGISAQQQKNAASFRQTLQILITDHVFCW
ncbi:MAG: MFS transporter [Pseudomonadales bacterium]|nr:MFS transporter [Pseudomonadales bacterium]